MPAKVTPVIPQAGVMVSAQVVGNDATIAWSNALGSNFDLNVMMPVIGYNRLQSVHLLSQAADHLAAKCIDAENCFASNKSTPRGEVRVVADPRAAESI